jgi:cysteinyl-tRNA synthetase
LRLYNTLTAREEEFVPVGEEALIYVCGITPYAESHLGHAMSYIIFDVLRRYLEYRGVRVRHVQNFTDIDDKLIARSQRDGTSVHDLTERFIGEYQRDMAALNVLPAHVYPRATEEIPAIIAMIEGLIEKGFAYEGPPLEEGGPRDVYYRVSRKADYGKLSKRDRESLAAGARVEPAEGKEDPVDFTLWKAAKPGEPSWESPWGPGRPGWHIECSAMAFRHLGPQVDLHGGGLDLVFPHHENEIAQTEAFTGKAPFSRFWVHHGLLQLGEEKMSKSLANLITIAEGLERFGADAIRIFVLGSNYRRPLTYSEEAIGAAKQGAQRLRGALDAVETSSVEAVDAAPFRQRFVAAMDDDLNTPQALAALFDLAREINRARDAGRGIAAGQALLRELAGVLGLRLEKEEPAAAAPFIDLLVQVRQELRAAKEYALADRVRAGLAELGIALEDTPSGTTWERR